MHGRKNKTPRSVRCDARLIIAADALSWGRPLNGDPRAFHLSYGPKFDVHYYYPYVEISNSENQAVAASVPQHGLCSRLGQSGNQSGCDLDCIGIIFRVWGSKRPGRRGEEERPSSLNPVPRLSRSDERLRCGREFGSVCRFAQHLYTARLVSSPACPKQDRR